MTVIPEWTLADRLRKARHQAGANQRTFADRLGVTPSTYAQWEAGRATPRNLIRLAKRVEVVADVPATWLLDLERPRQDSNLQPTDLWVLAA